MNGTLNWVASDALDFEIGQIPNTDRKERVSTLRSFAQSAVRINESVLHRSRQISALGIADLDALHIACAELDQVDIFFTTDDRLLLSARRIGLRLNIAVENPLDWLAKIKESTNEN